MNVGDSIRYSLDHWDNDEWEPAMLHACMAVDGTASKLYPDLGNRERFERMVRENIAVLTQWTAPGINLEKSLFPVRLKRGQPRQPMDTAAILYKVQRCTHGHGDELPEGFHLTPGQDGAANFSVDIESGTVSLSTGTILGLIAVAFLSPVNIDQQIPMAYHLRADLMDHEEDRRDSLWLPIHQWWGRLDDFLNIQSGFQRPSVTLEFRPEHFK